jgi:hypothetical protein
LESSIYKIQKTGLESLRAENARLKKLLGHKSHSAERSFLFIQRVFAPEAFFFPTVPNSFY